MAPRPANDGLGPFSIRPSRLTWGHARRESDAGPAPSALGRSAFGEPQRQGGGEVADARMSIRRIRGEGAGHDGAQVAIPPGQPRRPFSIHLAQELRQKLY